MKHSDLKLKPCPICGRIPKIKRDYKSEVRGYGARCTIQCKFFLRKPHYKITHSKASWNRALYYAIVDWNNSI